MDRPNPDNPFSYRRQRWYESGAWWLAIVVIVVGGAYAIPHASKLFLLAELNDDISKPLTASHRQRIDAIGKLGEDGLPVLVKALSHEDMSVARSATQTILETQQTAIDKIDYERQLIRELSSSLNEIPAGRWHIVRPLVEQTLADTLADETPAASSVHRDATTLLARIAPDTRSQGNTALAIDTSVQNPLQQPGELSRPSINATVPITSTSPVQFPNTQQIETTVQEDLWFDPGKVAATLEDTVASDNGRIKPAMITREVAETSQRIHEAGLPIGTEPRVLIANEVGGGDPLAAYSTRAVIDLLGSIRPEISTRARDELVQRGFSQEELILAVRLASSNASVRIAVIDEVPHRSDVDPRRWLLWLADDGERTVRLKALSALATMNDPNVTRRLRELLLTEQDKVVAAQIRDAILR